MEKLRTFSSKACSAHLNWVEPLAGPGQPIYPNALWTSSVKTLMDLGLLVYFMSASPVPMNSVRAGAVATRLTAAFPAPGTNICMEKRSVILTAGTNHQYLILKNMSFVLIISLPFAL